MSPVSRLSFSHLLSHSSSHVPCHLSHVSRAVNAADLIFDDLVVLRSKLVELGNLAVLTILADLADWGEIFVCRHEI